MLNNELRSLFSCNLLRFGYDVSGVKENTYTQNKGGFIMDIKTHIRNQIKHVRRAFLHARIYGFDTKTIERELEALTNQLLFLSEVRD